MLHEFAIDPNCFSSLDSFQRIAEGCGVSEGRYIADLPSRRWSQCVLKRLISLFPERKNAIEDILVDLKRQTGLIASRKNGSFEWIDAVVEEHAIIPFDAVVTDNETFASRVSIEQLSRNREPWKVERGIRCQKSSAEIARIATSLFRISNEVRLVDQYFQPSDPRFVDLLQALVGSATRHHTHYDSFQYHCSFNDRNAMKNVISKEVWIARFISSCKKKLPPVMSNGFKLMVVLWDKNKGTETNASEAMHARYIMTEKGALKVDYGLATSKEGETTDIIGLRQLFTEHVGMIFA